MGNGEAKEFTCMTHGRELRGVGGIPEEMRILVGGGQRKKNWDNCNSMINKLYLKRN